MLFMTKQQTISAKEYQAMISKPETKSKYRNKPKVYRGRTYHSTLEADYAATLDLKIKAGIVKEWTPQYRLPLYVKDQLVTTYIIDFKVEYTNGKVQLVECKGMELAEWKTKYRLAEILLEDIEPEAELIIVKKV